MLKRTYAFSVRQTEKEIHKVALHNVECKYYLMDAQKIIVNRALLDRK